MNAPLHGALNMAIDHALLEKAQRDRQAVLRLYRWEPACLSFGRNQPANGLYDEDAARALGIDIVRRPTGGFSVLHAQEITYAFVAPVELLGGPRASYVAINRALVEALRQLGTPAELSTGGQRSPFGSMHPCFAEPAAGEVIVNGRKLIGSAQRCEKRMLLQHGSLLLDGTQDAVAAIARVPFALDGQATSLHEVLGEVPPLEEITSAITRGFESECGLQVDEEARPPAITERAIELSALYRSPQWTWRH